MDKQKDLNDLTLARGIGPKSAEKLIEEGIKDLPALAVLRPEELADILRITKKAAVEAINSAKEIALDEALRLMSLEEVQEEITKKVIRYSTGSLALDHLIGGGIATNEITGLRGPFSVGKTQIAKSVAVSCIESGRKVAWIETEPGTFKEDRILEIASARHVSVDLKEDMFVIPSKFIVSPNHQFLAYERINGELSKGKDFGLIVVDSFSPRFREFYPRREMFPARSQETGRHIGYLQSLAAKYNLAVLITVQVMGIPDESRMRLTQMQEASEEAMYGGHVIKHGVQTWIALRKKSKADSIWEAELIDSSYLPPGSALFRIDQSGVCDIEAKRGKG